MQIRAGDVFFLLRLAWIAVFSLSLYVQSNVSNAMRISLLLLYIIGICCLPSYACAQQIFAKPFPFFKQLPTNEMADMHQDREGFLWIATSNGLARYDGYQLVTFQADYKRPHLLSANMLVNVDDSRRYVWIAGSGGVDLYDKQTCRISPIPDKRLQGKRVTYVAVGHDDHAWVAVDRRLYRCDADARVVKVYDLVTPQGVNRRDVVYLYVDQGGRVWALTKDGLFGYDAKADGFVHYPSGPLQTSAYTFYQDREGRYWITTWGTGLWRFHPDRTGDACYESCAVQNPRSGVAEGIIFCIEQDDTYGYYWMLSYGGLLVYRYDDGHMQPVDVDHVLDTQMMYTRLFKDREGSLWLQSWDMAYTIYFDNSGVVNYPLLQVKQKLGWDANVLQLSRSDDGMLWFRQDRAGVCLYDPQHDVFVNTEIPEINFMLSSKAQPGVWVNQRYAPHVMRLTQQGMKLRVEEDIQVGGVNGLAEDREGNLWINLWHGLCVKRPGHDSLLWSDSSMPDMVALMADTEGQIWGLSYAKELYRLQCRDGRITRTMQAQVSPLLDHENVNGYCIDRNGCVWLHTSLGRVMRSDSTKQAYEEIPWDMADGVILNILADDRRVWVVANKRVGCFDLDSGDFQDYTPADENVEVNFFRERAACLDGQGGLYVGGHGGIVYLPSRRKASATSQDGPSHLYVTDVNVNARSIFFDPDGLQGQNTVRKVSLPPNASNVEISFSSLSYALDRHLRTAYRMDGVDHDWVYVGDERMAAFYNRLPKGSHRLWVRQESPSGQWTEPQLMLVVERRPAVYETWYAWLCYVLLAGVCLWLCLRFYLRRLGRKSELKLQEEMTQTKLAYFTNVSHELLTPLTVITCIADYLEQRAPALHHHLSMLKGNADKLRRLMQQVLDFRKIDLGKLRLNVTEGNLHDFLQNICQTEFLPLTQQKSQRFDINIQTEDMEGFADFDKLDKMVHNLLSNAVKYTPEHRAIGLEARTEDDGTHRRLVVRVTDEGIGIPAKELPHIFTRFYSSKKERGVVSNGIGLSLTKDLVELHHGTISVQSAEGKGSTFVIVLPIDRDSFAPGERVDEADVLSIPDALSAAADAGTGPTAADAPGDKPAGTPHNLLLVDDNAELLDVMRALFESRYVVYTAADGNQAMDCVENHDIDLMVCDVMLPDTSGWELCARLKADVRYSHIPIIILTAKNGIDDRVTSYEAGADAYIAKPFEAKVLLARADNLLRTLEMRRAAFGRVKDTNLDSLSYPKPDKVFLDQLIQVIDRHLGEENFDMASLCDEFSISKSSLYRKIKSVTGMSPIDFLRNVKMKRACTMLQSGMSIADVAYALGYSSPKYFSRCFKDEFGMSPRDYQQNHPA